MFQRFGRKLRLTFLAAGALVSLISTADAASICARLQTRLNSATVTIGNTRQVHVYARAIAQQNREILKVRSDIRRYGCSSGSIIVFGGPNAQTCQLLTSTLKRMLANLKILEHKKVDLKTNSMSKSTRRRLLAALEANGCNDVRSETSLKPSLNINFPSSPESNAQPEDYQIHNLGGVADNGNLQTVCVRTCDGGFFPISSNASSASFARDAKVCSMMCPGTQTQLFYHSLSGQEIGEMVSADTGKAYQDEPYAFKYRTPPVGGSKSCGCNFSAYYREMMRRENGKADPSGEAEKYSAISSIKSKLNLRESSPPKEVHKEIPAKSYNPDNKNIRHVGPVFLPNDANGIDLRHPAETAASSK